MKTTLLPFGVFYMILFNDVFTVDIVPKAAYMRI